MKAINLLASVYMVIVILVLCSMVIFSQDYLVLFHTHPVFGFILSGVLILSLIPAGILFIISEINDKQTL